MKRLFMLLTLILTATILTTSTAAAPRDEAKPGVGYNIIYYEEFNYDNNGNTDAVLKTLGWTSLSKSGKTAVTDPTAKLSIIDGRLYVENNKSGGKDSYFMILNDAKMFGAWQGDYTLQFDVTLTAAGDNARYIAILTDYKQDVKGTYHSFHLRINGSANSQARMNGKWWNFDSAGPYFAADQDDTDGTSSIVKKVLGKDYDGSQILKNRQLTVRIVCEKFDVGPRVYIRDAAKGGEFVLVSRAGGDAVTSSTWRSTGGKAIVLKAGGTINGYIDNILVYTGTGEPVFEELKIPETTAAPETAAPTETTSAPETETDPVTETLTAPTESGCASFAAALFIPLFAAAFVLLKKK